MSVEDRSGITNAIWLCQTCAKLVDNDEGRFTTEQLIEWKGRAEADAFARIGKTVQHAALGANEREIKRNLRIRDRLQRLMVRPIKELRALRPKRPYEKFRTSKIVIRSVDDTQYPSVDRLPTGRMSSWVVLEPYDFYYGGIEVILNLRLVAVDAEGGWTFIDHDAKVDESRYRVAKAWMIGRIPWRNIREIDEKGDVYYRGPHLFCAFLENGVPYEQVVAKELGDEWDWPLDADKQRLDGKLD
jgi:hypothetical protein